MFCRYMTVPAENRWLALTPVTQQVALMHCFHGLLAFLEHYIHARNGGSQAQRKHMVLGPDYAILQDWNVTRSAYNRRAAAFIHGAFTGAKLLLYLSIVEPLMVLHYKFFKHGTRNAPSGPVSADVESKPGLCFDLAQPERSPVVPVLATLCQLLVKGLHDPATYPVWRPVLHKLGGRDWTDDLWWCVRAALLALIGGLVRKLLYVWGELPFGDLIRAFDPRSSDEVVQRSFDAFDDLRQCCLEPGVARKLRRRYKKLGRSRCARLRRFMVPFYNSVQLCSSSLECIFAGYRQWLRRSSKPLSAANLTSKDVVHKVSRDTRDLDHSNTSSRLPAWGPQSTKRIAKQGFHVYLHEKVKPSQEEKWTDVLKRGRAVYKKLDPSHRRTYACKARAGNLHRKALRTIELDGHVQRHHLTGSNQGYLSLGDGKHPFGVQKLKAAGYGNVKANLNKRKSGQWELTGRRVYPSKSFANGGVPPTHCCKEICTGTFSSEQQRRLQQIRWALEHATVSLAQQIPHNQPILQPHFASGPGAEMFQCLSMTKSRPGHAFAAEYAQMFDIGDDGVSDLCFCKENIGAHTVIKVVVSEALEAKWFRNDSLDALLGFDLLVCKRGPINNILTLSTSAAVWKLSQSVCPPDSAFLMM